MNMEENNELVTLAHFSNAADAGMACELLVNNGIAAILSGANFGALEPLPMFGGFSEIELLVPACELERAQELYDAFFNNEGNSFPKFEIVGDE
ncbi:MAG: DUF2007 domain-containing protein [Blastocatellia bacterium]|nr:DUF2007 domain-containing protein [Blastocatellia bacterium]